MGRVWCAVVLCLLLLTSCSGSDIETDTSREKGWYKFGDTVTLKSGYYVTANLPIVSKGDKDWFGKPTWKVKFSITIRNNTGGKVTVRPSVGMSSNQNECQLTSAPDNFTIKNKKSKTEKYEYSCTQKPKSKQLVLRFKVTQTSSRMYFRI